MKLKIFSGQISIKLARKIAAELGQKLGKKEYRKFSDGEIWVRYKEDIRGKDAFIIQSFPPPAENFLELLLMIDAAKRARAKKVVAVVPYFGYARQDKQEQDGVPISAELAVNLIMAAGADRILTTDFHSGKIIRAFNSIIKNISAKDIFLKNLKSYSENFFKNLAVLAPDSGRLKMAESYAQQLKNCQIAVIDKYRPAANRVKIKGIDGKVKNRKVLIIDDIIDTGNTLVAVANTVKKEGAKEIYAFVTHGLFSGKAINKINKSPISKLFISDTIPLSYEKRSIKIKLVSVAPLLAQTIKGINRN